jgi:N-dimethylarginine dimethylaminohydrolase
MSKVNEVFKSEESVLKEFNRLTSVLNENGSVIASYECEILYDAQVFFEDAGFLVEDKDVAGKTYTVISNSTD